MQTTRRNFFKISGILAGLAVLNPVKLCQAIGNKKPTHWVGEFKSAILNGDWVVKTHIMPHAYGEDYNLRNIDNEMVFYSNTRFITTTSEGCFDDKGNKIT